MASPNKPRPIQERFSNAVEVIRSLPKEGPFQPSNTVKLRFYALFKQANIGPCNIAKPAFWDATGRAKWEAWNVCGNMSKELAMQMYVEELQQLVETMPQTKEVEQFLKSIGPFYELTDTEEGGDEEIPEDPNANVNGSKTEGGAEEKEDDSEEESGGESDVSEDFQESFQNLPISSPSNQSFELVSPYTPRTQSQSHLQSENPLPNHSEEEADGPRSSRSSHQTGGGPGHQERLRVSSEINPIGSEGSFPSGLEVVVSQLTSLQQNVQSLLQQVNVLSTTVHGLTQQHPQQRGRVLTVLIKLGPLLVVGPLIVNLVMVYLSKRYKRDDLPSWVWGMLTLVHAVFSVALGTYCNRF